MNHSFLALFSQWINLPALWSYIPFLDAELREEIVVSSGNKCRRMISRNNQTLTSCVHIIDLSEAQPSQVVEFYNPELNGRNHCTDTVFHQLHSLHSFPLSHYWLEEPFGKNISHFSLYKHFSFSLRNLCP